MKIQILPYKLKFNKAFKTGVAYFKSREGLILSAADNKITAYGEAAPLPGFSQESLNEVNNFFKQFVHQIPEFLFLKSEKDKNEFIDSISPRYPSVLFALDTLWHDWHAKREGIPLQKFLFDQYQEQIFCNAVISSSSVSQMYNQLHNFINDGFQSIKLKVGIASEIELNFIKKIRDEFPDINIRLDANRNWNKEFAIHMLSELEPLKIEFCEEPTKDLKDIRHATSIPLAADESVRTFSQAASVINNGLADVLILKPMLFGSLNSIFVTNKLAEYHNIEVVYTSSFESIVGRTMISVIAAGCGSSKYHHGLATGGFFNEDLDGRVKKNFPVFSLNDKPGLGIDVNIINLKNGIGA